MAPLKRTSVLRLNLNLNRPPPFDGRIHARHRSTRSGTTTTTNPNSTALPKPRLDYRAISENAVYKSHNAFNRKAPLPVGAIQSIERLYNRHKELSHLLNGKRHAQSLIGDRIRQLQARTSTSTSTGSTGSGNNGNNGDGSGEEARRTSLLQAAKQLKAEILQLEQDLSQIDDQLFTLASAVPNDTHPLAPLGASSSVLSTHGPPHPIPHAPQRDHLSISRQLGLLDLEAGATVTGSSWYYLLREAALLETALTNYGLSIALSHGFTPVTTPDVVRSDVARRCGFHPRDTNPNTANANANTPAPSQMYHLAPATADNHHHHPPNADASKASNSSHSHPDLVLSGTAEIPLAGMFANKVLALQDLPLKVVGLGRAFRAEAGARGVDTRGLYRVHQFTKLELFAVTRASESEEMMEEMRRVQIEIFGGLGFPFRVLDMPAEELGASAYRKYDIEAWMPGRGSWGEISSLSNCTDYQARRLHIRHRPAPPTPPSPSPQTFTGLPFAHTLNGTAVAVPRLIVALLENGARFNDSGQVVGINLPVALKPFWPQAYSREAVRFSGREIVQWV